MARDPQWSQDIRAVAERTAQTADEGYGARLREAYRAFQDTVLPLLVDVERVLVNLGYRATLTEDRARAVPAVTLAVGDTRLDVWVGVERVQDDLFPVINMQYGGHTPTDVYAPDAVPNTDGRTRAMLEEFVQNAVADLVGRRVANEEKERLGGYLPQLRR